MKFVFCINPFHGHINPTIGIVTELVRRGNEVYYFSTEQYQNQIENAGAKVIPYSNYGQLFEWGIEKRTADLTQNIEYLLLKYLFPTRSDYKNFIVTLENQILKLDPDFLIYDYFDGYWAKQTAAKLNIPSIASVTSFAVCRDMVNACPDDCIKYALRLPVDDPFFLLNDANKQKLIRLLSLKLKEAYNDEKDFNILDFGNSDYLNIVYTCRDFQPFGQLFDDRFIFIGCQFDSRKEVIDFPIEQSSNKHLIYISLGTTDINEQSDFYIKCFRALENMNVTAVLSIGHNTTMESLGPIPDNFIVRRENPQLEILKKASIFINHGGMNGVNEALFYGVPLIVMPQQGDQHAVGNQVDKLKLGINLIEKNIDEPLLKSSVEHILFNFDEYRKRCLDFSHKLKTAGGYSYAVDKILGLSTKKHYSSDRGINAK